MNIETIITLKDFQAFASFVGRPRNPAIRFLEPAIYGIGGALVINLLRAAFRIEYHGLTMLVTLFVTIFIMLAFFIVKSRRLLPTPDGLMLGRKHLRISTEGLHHSSDQVDCHYGWSLVRHVEVTPGHVFVMLDRNAGLIVPRSAFGDAAECDRFVSLVNEFAGKACVQAKAA